LSLRVKPSRSRPLNSGAVGRIRSDHDQSLHIIRRNVVKSAKWANNHTFVGAFAPVAQCRRFRNSVDTEKCSSSAASGNAFAVRNRSDARKHTKRRNASHRKSAPIDSSFNASDELRVHTSSDTPKRLR